MQTALNSVLNTHILNFGFETNPLKQSIKKQLYINSFTIYPTIINRKQTINVLCKLLPKSIQTFNYTTWITACYNILRNITCNNTACSNNSIVTY